VSRPLRFARLVVVAGLATAVAAAAHDGPGVLADPALAAAGLAGASVALIGGLAGWRLIVRSGSAPAPLPLPLVAAGLVGAQLAAHWALIGAGAPAHAGSTGTLALHALAAGLVAAVVRTLEGGATRLLSRGRPPLGSLLRTRRWAPVARPCDRPGRGSRHGRAPPEPA
jgi:peptidoglycan/LPS O-acetylase OafA/YrhL